MPFTILKMSAIQKKLLIGGGILFAILAIGSISWYLSKSGDTVVEYNASGSIISDNGTTTQGGSGSVETTSEGRIGFVSDVFGEAHYLENSKKNPVEANLELKPGSILVTEEGASIAIILTDNSVLRMGEKTTLSFSKANAVTLEDGDVWARIIKPLTDDSLFTIETSDSSAGIRGTAAFVQKTQTRTRIAVVDSSYQNEPVIVTYDENGSKTEEKLNTEEVLEISKQGKKKRTENAKNILENYEFTQEFIKQDIIYLIELEKKKQANQNNTNTGAQEYILKKIRKEIQESMPTDDEIDVFFSSENTRKAMRLLKQATKQNQEKSNDGTPIQSGDGSGSLGLSDQNKEELLLEIIRGDLEITREKQVLRQLRNSTNSPSNGGNNGTNTSNNESITQDINKQEEKIRAKEQAWLDTFTTKLNEKRSANLGSESTGSGETSTGGVISVPPDAANTQDGSQTQSPEVKKDPASSAQPLGSSQTTSGSPGVINTSNTKPTITETPIKPASTQPTNQPANTTGTKSTVSGPARIITPTKPVTNPVTKPVAPLPTKPLISGPAKIR